MKLFIKYMVSNRCKMLVKDELRKLGLHFIVVDLGEVEIMEALTPNQRNQLKVALLQSGLELMDDKKSMLIEKIKTVIINMVHYSDSNIKVNFSSFLSEKLHHDYTYMSNLFSEVQGTTIEHFIIAHKTERIKELIIYGEYSITEIAWQMKLQQCRAFVEPVQKKSPAFPLRISNSSKTKKRCPIEEVGNFQ